jgi:hypothetical protein
MENFLPILATFLGIVLTGISGYVIIFLNKKMKEAELTMEIAAIKKTSLKLQANAIEWKLVQEHIHEAVSSVEQQYTASLKTGIPIPKEQRKPMAIELAGQLLALHGIQLSPVMLGAMIESYVLDLGKMPMEEPSREIISHVQITPQVNTTDSEQFKG